MKERTDKERINLLCNLFLVSAVEQAVLRGYWVL